MSKGQEEYSAMREQYMRNGEGFLLVFSVTSRASFDDVKDFYKQILRVKDRDEVPVLLVANKCDLESSRVITSEEGKELARSFSCRYVEASARLRVNVDEAFHYLVKTIREDASHHAQKPEKDETKVKKKKKNCIVM